jgi:ribonuclease R
MGWEGAGVKREKDLLLLPMLRRRTRPNSKPRNSSVLKNQGYQPPPVPPTLVAEVVSLTPHPRGRILHKELAGAEWHLLAPQNLTLTAGCFVQGAPAAQNHHTLVVEKLVPATMAATAAAVANHGLTEGFTPTELAEANALTPYTWNLAQGRDDWRKLPFITIDGEDARDFDDAVWAEPLPNGGHFVRVAIADVAHYVTPGSVLDTTAQRRGTSTYFPNLVLPMLPEALSNNLCSLVPMANRPTLGVEMWLSAQGHLQHYRFCRATIHSAARCTYLQVQNVLDGKQAAPSPAVAAVINQLNDAFIALLSARDARGAISLEVPELKLELTSGGAVQAARPRPRLAAHMLIEELMICANVAAATALSFGCADTRPGYARKHHGGAGVYRVHAPPLPEKLDNLRNVLAPLGFTAPPVSAKPAAWSALAKRMLNHPAAPTLQRALLQAQMQARYSTENIGHFGLALQLYTHFTSPIRRYADLLVHRHLLHLIEGNQPKTETAALERICEHINLAERRSQQAEWEARDRMLAGFMANQVGEVFKATITNVAPFGCFVSLADGLAEALLPKWELENYAYVGSLNAFKKVHGGKGLLRAGVTLPLQLLSADFALGRLSVGFPPAGPSQSPKVSKPSAPHRRTGHSHRRARRG